MLNYQRILGEGAREERKEYNREKQAEGRAKKKANGGTVRPEHRDDGGKKPRIASRNTPPTNGAAYPDHPPERDYPNEEAF